MLTLPYKFKKDTRGNNFQIMPLVRIDGRINLSTHKIIINAQSRTYHPLVKNISTVNESIDLQDKNFKISNVNIDFYNCEYQNEYLSELFFKPSIINKKVGIRMITQSGTQAGDGLLVYEGYVKNIKHNSDIISIELEDKTEEVLDKELPIEMVSDNEEIPDKYKNKKIPLVYGYVEKAPCLYYNLYESAIEDGSTKYSITPDNFAINQIYEPYIFDNDAYLKIRNTSSLFAQQSENTLYESSPRTQYNILGNKILVEKSQILDDSADLSDQVVGFNTSPIGYNYVETEHESDLVYSGGNYNLHYTETGGLGQKRTAKIQMFEDIDGETPSSVVNGSYLDVKDFSNIPENLASSEYWLWGNNDAIDLDNYFNIYGESLMSFEASSFASDSNLLKQLAVNNNDFKDIKGQINLVFSLEADIDALYDEGSFLPNLMLRGDDYSVSMWNIDEDDLQSNLYYKTGQTSSRLTKNIASNIIQIGQREFNAIHQNFTLVHQNGAIKWLKINNLKLKRVAILKDFTSYDIYADVEGRVDDINGTYTGVAQLTSEERANYFQGNDIDRLSDRGITALQPAKKSIKQQSLRATQAIQQVVKKPQITVKSETIKKDGSY